MIRRAEKSGRLLILHADIGPVGDFGTPLDATGSNRYADHASVP
jgi:hypothetical protein